MVSTFFRPSILASILILASTSAFGQAAWNKTLLHCVDISNQKNGVTILEGENIPSPNSSAHYFAEVRVYKDNQERVLRYGGDYYNKPNVKQIIRNSVPNFDNSAYIKFAAEYRTWRYKIINGAWKTIALPYPVLELVYDLSKRIDRRTPNGRLVKRNPMTGAVQYRYRLICR